MRTLAEVTGATGFAVLEYLEAEAEVPVLDGLQAQGDLIIKPLDGRPNGAGTSGMPPTIVFSGPVRRMASAIFF